MKRLSLILVATAIAVSLAGAAAAQPGGPWPARREWRQHARIERGIARGQLTQREAWRLRMGQRHVRRMELRFRERMAWGDRMTWRERVRLHRAFDRQSLRIWRLRHNGRVI